MQELVALEVEFLVILIKSFPPLSDVTESFVLGAVGFLDMFHLPSRFKIDLIKNIHSH